MVSRASFLIFFSATILLLPLAWHAAQFAVKTPAPFSRSAASAGRLPKTAASKPSAAPKASGLKERLVWVRVTASMVCTSSSALASLLTGGAVCGAEGATKHCAPKKAAEATIRRHCAFDMATRTRTMGQQGEL